MKKLILIIALSMNAVASPQARRFSPLGAIAGASTGVLVGIKSCEPMFCRAEHKNIYWAQAVASLRGGAIIALFGAAGAVAGGFGLPMVRKYRAVAGAKKAIDRFNNEVSKRPLDGGASIDFVEAKQQLERSFSSLDPYSGRSVEETRNRIRQLLATRKSL